MPAVSATQALATEAAVLNPHVIAGSAAIVIALLSLLVYLYRRRLFILWWVGAWTLLATSMLILARGYGSQKLGALVYGLSQLMGVLSGLAFVVAADAYRQRPRLTRTYGLVLLPIAIYFLSLPVGLDRDDQIKIVFSLGHLLIAGAMAAAAAAPLLLLRYTRLLGATIVGGALLAIAGLNTWM